jgi:hypothetical protein
VFYLLLFFSGAINLQVEKIVQVLEYSRVKRLYGAVFHFSENRESDVRFVERSTRERAHVDCTRYRVQGNAHYTARYKLLQDSKKNA